MTTPFVERHIGIRPEERDKMLADLGYSTASELLSKAVPEVIQDATLRLPEAMSEADALAALAEIAGRNQVFDSLIGMGWNDCITPPVIRRNLFENPAWYTSYTPYQPEISQGRLELLLTFQTMVADLTGCELANASLLDEATAAAEAMTMLRRVARSKRTGFFVDADCHPQTIEVLSVRAEPLGIEVTVGDPATLAGEADHYFGVLVAQPASSGQLRDLTPIIEAAHEGEALVAVTTDLLACTLITPPGELGADVVVGSAQRLGVPMGFGGPHAGFMATAQKHARQLPGRLVGVSIDANGNPAYRLTLQTREQHIRREKATSNICTAQALLANIAAAYAAYHGPEGLTAIAKRINALTGVVADAMVAAGLTTNQSYFDTLTVKVPGRADAVLAAAAEAKINLRKVDDDHIGLSFDETSDVELAVKVINLLTGTEAPVGSEHITIDESGATRIPTEMIRSSRFLTHPNFHRYRSETEMMRWLRRLSDRDLALDRTMIPLGSCTMKLNAAAEMEPVSWPEFAGIHPFAPADQTVGYREMIADLVEALAEITGYHTISLQPNAGSQGEYAGLLAIRAWHAANGDSHREVCLIPESAHGTNAASAILAGMRVVVTACDDQGNIDLQDLAAKIEAHRDELAALMITYPSTHGVYEETVGQVCAMIHDAGGQVYTDGANLNALVGVAKPGKFGSDVSHLNLHKTFCIPHGGGGPGVGPVGVAEHLAPYLPGHSVAPELADRPVGAVSAAPYGSASILPISWMYIKMMGGEGLRRATENAVLAANYVAKRLKEHFPVLYTGPNGLIAHECIIDIRPIEKATGINNDDIAKRLADYGFHAPTMSFPVPGTLMIEPTESEGLAELDRFCDAMIAIKGEIDEVASGKISAEASVLRNAPHTADVLMAEEWDRAYPRRQAAFPLPGMQHDRYFVPVGRIDNAYGDRNLSCACPPLSAYE